MNGSRVDEIRGIAHNQELDSEIEDILDKN